MCMKCGGGVSQEQSTPRLETQDAQILRRHLMLLANPSNFVFCNNELNHGVFAAQKKHCR